MDFLPKGRLDAFADGVFAIVITLLGTDLSIPDVSENLMPALIQEWPVFLAYIISFAFVGSVWISHSSITALMKQETPHSYRLTLLMLFFVSLIPFTTKLMAFYLSYPPTFPEIYGSDLLSAWLMFNTIARSAPEHSGNNLRLRSPRHIGYFKRDHEISDWDSYYAYQ